MRNNFAHQAKQAESDKFQERAAAQQQMKHWQADADSTGVRDQDALAKLPAEERGAWQQLWADVAKVLKRASEPR